MNRAGSSRCPGSHARTKSCSVQWSTLSTSLLSHIWWTCRRSCFKTASGSRLSSSSLKFLSSRFSPRTGFNRVLLSRTSNLHVPVPQVLEQLEKCQRRCLKTESSDALPSRSSTCHFPRWRNTLRELRFWRRTAFNSASRSRVSARSVSRSVGLLNRANGGGAPESRRHW